MSGAWTKGPWTVTGDASEDDALCVTCEARDGKVDIAEIQIDFDGPFESEQIANACLIAAAPDLYKALELATCLHIDEPGREGPDLHPLRQHGWDPSKETGPMFVARLARAALAKAGAL